jgi:hypothetical protein
MKAIKLLIAAAVILTLLTPAAQAQTIAYNLNTPVYPVAFYRDSVTINSGFAADSIFVSFHAPFKLRLAKVEVYMCTIDTGSAAVVRRFVLKKSTSGTAIATINFTSTAADTWAYNIAPSLSTLNAGETVRGIWTCGTGVRFKQVIVLLWYLRI